MPTKPRFAIVGLGVTRQGKLPEYTTRQVAAMAMQGALDDASMERGDVDGYIYLSNHPAVSDLRFHGIAPKFGWHMQTGGATAGAAVMAAIGALESGMANYVMVLGAHRLWSEQVKLGATARGIERAWGMASPIGAHALNAQRHMHVYGTTIDHLGAVAVTQRAYANQRPEAIMHKNPMTMEDHHNSPMICDPLRLLDCTRDTDGGVAVIITTMDRARMLPSKAVPILGWGAGHNIRRLSNKRIYDGLDCASARDSAFRMAGIETKDIDVLECYDAFTINVIMQLEGYGFCGEGEGGPFILEGNTRLDGRIPTNTAGGQLSGWYIMGMTPLAEGIRQMRGEGGATQVRDAEIGLVTGHGGAMASGSLNAWAHSAMVLGKAVSR